MTSNTLNVYVQNVMTESTVPEDAVLINWLKMNAKEMLSEQFDCDVKNVVKNQLLETVELSVRIVDETEMQEMNHQYRGKNKPTNVLSFPLSDDLCPIRLLGDIVVCAKIVSVEARAAELELEAHWAHMMTHGFLHLLGYDHETDEQAEEMELLEIKLLAQLGFSSPYNFSL